MVLLITASGQYSQHKKQADLPFLTGKHFSSSITGTVIRHSPVWPASPVPGDASLHM
jgi:hypothetical protein